MRKTWPLAGLLLVVGALAADAQAASAGEQAAAGVGERLRANDCGGAIKMLNEGLAAAYPQVSLMAGTMFDAGICVKKDWNKAIRFYSQASEGGIKEGAFRLAAGFAAEANGPDIGAALWWARQAGLDADRCTSRLPRTDDPDRFVEELRKWPQRELAECNFVVGLMSFLYAEVNYPIGGIKRELRERARIVYTPATQSFEVEPWDDRPAGKQAMGEVFSSALHHGAGRYRRPANMNSSWRIAFALPINADRSRWW